MPFEERHILFYLNEVAEILIANQKVLDDYVRFNVASFTILKVAHTSTLNRQMHEHKTAFESVMDIPRNDNSTLFYGVHKKLLQEKEVGFAVPDNIMINIFGDTCIAKGIKLPRAGHRTIISSDLAVGLKIELSEGGLELEGSF
ncbi:MAG: hypothetical protein AB8B83_04260 [Bdellovibrionales bacterium]